MSQYGLTRQIVNSLSTSASAEGVPLYANADAAGVPHDGGVRVRWPSTAVIYDDYRRGAADEVGRRLRAKVNVTRPGTVLVDTGPFSTPYERTFVDIVIQLAAEDGYRGSTTALGALTVLIEDGAVLVTAAGIEAALQANGYGDSAAVRMVSTIDDVAAVADTWRLEERLTGTAPQPTSTNRAEGAAPSSGASAAIAAATAVAVIVVLVCVAVCGGFIPDWMYNTLYTWLTNWMHSWQSQAKTAGSAPCASISFAGAGTGTPLSSQRLRRPGSPQFGRIDVPIVTAADMMALAFSPPPTPTNRSCSHMQTTPLPPQSTSTPPLEPPSKTRPKPMSKSPTQNSPQPLRPPPRDPLLQPLSQSTLQPSSQSPPKLPSQKSSQLHRPPPSPRPPLRSSPQRPLPQQPPAPWNERRARLERIRATHLGGKACGGKLTSGLRNDGVCTGQGRAAPGAATTQPLRRPLASCASPHAVRRGASRPPPRGDLALARAAWLEGWHENGDRPQCGSKESPPRLTASSHINEGAVHAQLEPHGRSAVCEDKQCPRSRVSPAHAARPPHRKLPADCSANRTGVDSLQRPSPARCHKHQPAHGPAWQLAHGPACQPMQLSHHAPSCRHQRPASSQYMAQLHGNTGEAALEQRAHRLPPVHLARPPSQKEANLPPPRAQRPTQPTRSQQTPMRPMLPRPMPPRPTSQPRPALARSRQTRPPTSIGARVCRAESDAVCEQCKLPQLLISSNAGRSQVQHPQHHAARKVLMVEDVLTLDA